jgi:molybdopterin synthase catalytic subunit
MPASPHDWLEIMAEPISPQRAIEFVTDPSAGGIDVFLGITRAENRAGRELVSLNYAAYGDMAMQQLQAFAADVRRRWPIVKLAILHRIGTVKIGEPSVLIAVSTPHRAEAFAACRWIIDTVKEQLTVWKEERWVDGSASWVHPD